VEARTGLALVGFGKISTGKYLGAGAKGIAIGGRVDPSAVYGSSPCARPHVIGVTEQNVISLGPATPRLTVTGATQNVMKLVPVEINSNRGFRRGR